MPPTEPSCDGEHGSTFAMAGDLAVDEKSPVSEHHRRGQRGLTGGVTLSVTLYLKNDFFYFAELNE